MTPYSEYDHLFDPVIILGPNKDIVYFNHQATIFFKLPPRLIRKKNGLTELCTSPELDFEKWISTAIATGDIQLSTEIKIILPHDKATEYFAIVKIFPVESAPNTSFAIVFHDRTVEISLHTKYRDQLEELKKTHAQIMQADKLTTLGEITANISHEINNPLTIASGHSEILKAYLSSPAPLEKIGKIKIANETVIDSLERVNKIIKNMKDFLHQSEDKKEYCDLSEMIISAIKWIEPMAQKTGVKIENSFSINAVALINRIKVEQVVINLIKNSIEAITETTNHSGKVTVELLKSDSSEETWINIIDNGPGMPETIKQNLFKPFQSTKDAGNGIGLGLSICSKIIESHSGKLQLIEVKEGCQFRISLPLIELYSYTKNDRLLSGATQQTHVLVLDQEVQNLNVLNSFISDENLVFVGSSDPDGALSFLQKANIDLVLTGAKFPQMTGSDFSAKARQGGYLGPILYLLDSTDKNSFNRDKDTLNISGMILSPFAREEVVNMIRVALEMNGGKV
jgi:signal transduction histidine kinase/CheY-like chemotaxis protein